MNTNPKDTWFSYDPGDGFFRLHDTEEEARTRAEEAFEFYRSEAVFEGWDVEVEQICWGKCSQRVELLWRKQRPPPDQLDESNCDNDGIAWGELEEIIDYALLPEFKGQPK